jgi:hypothetical protein
MWVCKLTESIIDIQRNWEKVFAVETNWEGFSADEHNSESIGKEDWTKSCETEDDAKCTLSHFAFQNIWSLFHPPHVSCAQTFPSVPLSPKIPYFLISAFEAYFFVPQMEETHSFKMSLNF